MAALAGNPLPGTFHVLIPQPTEPREFVEQLNRVWHPTMTNRVTNYLAGTAATATPAAAIAPTRAQMSMAGPVTQHNGSVGTATAPTAAPVSGWQQQQQQHYPYHQQHYTDQQQHYQQQQQPPMAGINSMQPMPTQTATHQVQWGGQPGQQTINSNAGYSYSSTGNAAPVAFPAPGAGGAPAYAAGGYQPVKTGRSDADDDDELFVPP